MSSFSFSRSSRSIVILAATTLALAACAAERKAGAPPEPAQAQGTGGYPYASPATPQAQQPGAYPQPSAPGLSGDADHMEPPRPEAPPPPPTPSPSGGYAPPPTPQGRAISMREATSEIETSQRELDVAGGDCRNACRALGSMDRAAGRLCTLAQTNDEQLRCSSAKTRVYSARDKVKNTCGSCPDTSVDRSAPIPSR